MAKTVSSMLPLATPCPSFALPEPAAAHRLVSLQEFAGRPLLVMFICNHCPFVQHLRPALAQLGREAQARGLGVVAINSNDADAYPQDAPDKMAAEVGAAGYSFAYLFDASQQVARAFQAACTPDFYLFDAHHRLVYRGRFDASRPQSEVPVSGADLRAAIDTLLAGQPPLADQQPSLGCNIKWRH